MSGEPNYQIDLATSAYLTNSQTEQPALEPVAASTTSPLDVLTWLSKVVGGIVVAGILIAVTVNLTTVSAQKRDRPTCGVDWLFWAAGSDKTFESVLTAKLKKSRRDFERQQAEANSKLKPFEIKEFDMKSLNWNPQPFGGKK